MLVAFMEYWLQIEVPVTERECVFAGDRKGLKPHSMGSPVPCTGFSVFYCRRPKERKAHAARTRRAQFLACEVQGWLTVYTVLTIGSVLHLSNRT
jgi:hypothetical protein